MKYVDLISSAQAARPRAYAPYSKFPVGAALQTKSGTVYVGANIENRSLGLCICAERVAIAAAVMSGERDFIAIAAVAADSNEPIVPCGACRQVLAEFKADLLIVSANLRGEQDTRTLSELLPHPIRGILNYADPS